MTTIVGNWKSIKAQNCKSSSDPLPRIPTSIPIARFGVLTLSPNPRQMAQTNVTNYLANALNSIRAGAQFQVEETEIAEVQFSEKSSCVK